MKPFPPFYCECKGYNLFRIFIFILGFYSFNYFFHLSVRIHGQIHNTFDPLQVWFPFVAIYPLFIGYV